MNKMPCQKLFCVIVWFALTSAQLQSTKLAIAPTTTKTIDRQTRAETVPPSCLKMCNKMYAPVCVRNRTSQVTHPSKCSFEVEQCQSPPGSMQLLCEYPCPCPVSVRSAVVTKPPVVMRLSTLPATKKCPQMCPAIYRPICAVNNLTNMTKDFSSPCELNVHNCNNPKSSMQLLCESMCPCPVSVSSSLLTTSPVVIQPSILPVTKRCIQSCPEIYRPICAASKLTNKTKEFSNSCELSLHNCSYPKDSMQALCEGQCPCADSAKQEPIIRPIIVILPTMVPRPITLPEKRECPQMCTMQYQPVCGVNKSSNETRVFSNPCAMSVHNCNSPENKFEPACSTNLCSICPDANNPEA